MLFVTVGTAFMERADLGISMVVAPAYLLHRKISEFLPFYSFGMSEYIFQAVLLLLLCLIVRRFKKSWLFSFVTAVFYGFLLDGALWLTTSLPMSALWARILFYGLGMVMGSIGVALLFHTYIAPEVYELFVSETAGHFSLPIPTVKTVYDIVSCLLGVLLSFLFFGLWHFEGVKLGTVLCALVNGPLIGAVSDWLDRTFLFTDRLPLRKLFEQ